MLDRTDRDLMKQLFGQPARGHWRLLKPSRVISRGFTRSGGRDHRLVPAVEVEVSTELALGVDLEVMPEPVARVTP